MKRTKRIVSLLLALAMVAGGVTIPNAYAEDYSTYHWDPWRTDYDTFGYDPYEEYYEEWNVPSVIQVYEERGVKAANNYVGLFKMYTHRADLEAEDLLGLTSKDHIQAAAAELDTLFPKLDTPLHYVPGVKESEKPKATGNEWPSVHGGMIYGNNNGMILPEEDVGGIYDADGNLKGMQLFDDDGNYLRDMTNGEFAEYLENKKNLTSSGASNDRQYFADVPSDAWYAEAVNAMAETGLLHGYEDGTFRPNNPLTTAEWATILWNIYGTELESDDQAYVKDRRTGARTTHWGSLAIYWGDYYGYLVGAEFLHTYTLDQDGNPIEFEYYLEDTPMERWRAVYSIVEMTKDGDGTYFTNSLVNNNQRDLNKKLLALQKKNGAKTDWAEEDIPDLVNFKYDSAYLRWITDAYNMGIVCGVDEAGNFNPHGTLTRAEACQMLYNAHITEPRPVKSKTPNLIYG